MMVILELLNWMKRKFLGDDYFRIIQHAKEIIGVGDLQLS